MPRIVRDSDVEDPDNLERKGITAVRRTRSSISGTVDSPVRRSMRIKQNSSPDSLADDSTAVGNNTIALVGRTTRSKAATMDKGLAYSGIVTRKTRSRRNSASSDLSEIYDPEDNAPKRITRRVSMSQSTNATPTKITRSLTLRAGSETRSSTPTTRTRVTRASSVDFSGNESVATPVKKRTRASIVPAEPTVREEQEFKEQANKTFEKTILMEESFDTFKMEEPSKKTETLLTTAEESLADSEKQSSGLSTKMVDSSNGKVTGVNKNGDKLKLANSVTQYNKSTLESFITVLDSSKGQSDRTISSSPSDFSRPTVTTEPNISVSSSKQIEKVDDPICVITVDDSDDDENEIIDVVQVVESSTVNIPTNKVELNVKVHEEQPNDNVDKIMDVKNSFVKLKRIEEPFEKLHENLDNISLKEFQSRSDLTSLNNQISEVKTAVVLVSDCCKMIHDKIAQTDKVDEMLSSTTETVVNAEPIKNPDNSREKFLIDVGSDSDDSLYKMSVDDDDDRDEGEKSVFSSNGQNKSEYISPVYDNNSIDICHEKNEPYLKENENSFKISNISNNDIMLSDSKTIKNNDENTTCVGENNNLNTSDKENIFTVNEGEKETIKLNDSAVFTSTESTKFSSENKHNSVFVKQNEKKSVSHKDSAIINKKVSEIAVFDDESDNMSIIAEINSFIDDKETSRFKKVKDHESEALGEENLSTTNGNQNNKEMDIDEQIISNKNYESISSQKANNDEIDISSKVVDNLSSSQIQNEKSNKDSNECKLKKNASMLSMSGNENSPNKNKSILLLEEIETTKLIPKNEKYLDNENITDLFKHSYLKAENSESVNSLDSKDKKFNSKTKVCDKVIESKIIDQAPITNNACKDEVKNSNSIKHVESKDLTLLTQIDSQDKSLKPLKKPCDTLSSVPSIKCDITSAHSTNNVEGTKETTIACNLDVEMHDTITSNIKNQMETDICVEAVFISNDTDKARTEQMDSSFSKTLGNNEIKSTHVTIESDSNINKINVLGVDKNSVYSVVTDNDGDKATSSPEKAERSCKEAFGKITPAKKISAEEPKKGTDKRRSKVMESDNESIPEELFRDIPADEWCNKKLVFHTDNNTLEKSRDEESDQKLNKSQRKSLSGRKSLELKNSLEDDTCLKSNRSLSKISRKSLENKQNSEEIEERNVLTQYENTESQESNEKEGKSESGGDENESESCSIEKSLSEQSTLLESSVSLKKNRKSLNKSLKANQSMSESRENETESDRASLSVHLNTSKSSRRSSSANTSLKPLNALAVEKMEVDEDIDDEDNVARVDDEPLNNSRSKKSLSQNNIVESCSQNQSFSTSAARKSLPDTDEDDDTVNNKDNEVVDQKSFNSTSSANTSLSSKKDKSLRHTPNTSSRKSLNKSLNKSNIALKSESDEDDDVLEGETENDKEEERVSDKSLNKSNKSSTPFSLKKDKSLKETPNLSLRKSLNKSKILLKNSDDNNDKSEEESEKSKEEETFNDKCLNKFNKASTPFSSKKDKSLKETLDSSSRKSLNKLNIVFKNDDEDDSDSDTSGKKTEKDEEKVNNKSLNKSNVNTSISSKKDISLSKTQDISARNSINKSLKKSNAALKNSYHDDLSEEESKNGKDESLKETLNTSSRKSLNKSNMLFETNDIYASEEESEKSKEEEKLDNKSLNKSSKASTPFSSKKEKSSKETPSISRKSLNNSLNKSNTTPKAINVDQKLEEIDKEEETDKEEEKRESDNHNVSKKSLKSTKNTPLKSLLENNNKNDEIEEKLDVSLQKNVERMKYANPCKSTLSMVPQVGSESDDYEEVPSFIFRDFDSDSDPSNESDDKVQLKDSDESIDPDIASEYNLMGDSISTHEDDDIPGDDCLVSEEEYSDSDDNGSDLEGFIAPDDESETDDSDVGTENSDDRDESEDEGENEEEDQTEIDEDENEIEEIKVTNKSKVKENTLTNDSKLSIKKNKSLNKSSSVETESKKSGKDNLADFEISKDNFKSSESIKIKSVVNLDKNKSANVSLLNTSKSTSKAKDDKDDLNVTAKSVKDKSINLSKSFKNKSQNTSISMQSIDSSSEDGKQVKLSKLHESETESTDTCRIIVAKPEADKYMEKLANEIESSTPITKNSAGKIGQPWPWEKYQLSQSTQIEDEETPKTKFLKKSKLHDSFPILESMKSKDSEEWLSNNGKIHSAIKVDKVAVDKNKNQEIPEDVSKSNKKSKKRKLADLLQRESAYEDSVLKEISNKSKRASIEESVAQVPDEDQQNKSVDSLESKKMKKKLKKLRRKQAELEESLQNISATDDSKELQKKKKKKKSEAEIEEIQFGEELSEISAFAVEKQKKEKKKKSKEVGLEEKSAKNSLNAMEEPAVEIDNREIAKEASKKKKKKSKETAVQIAKEVPEIIIDTVEKPKKKKKSKETATQLKEEVLVTDTSEKQKKKKKKSIDIEETEEVISAMNHNEVVPVEKSQKKKKKRLSEQENIDTVNIQQNDTSKLSSGSESQKTKKKSKKRQKLDAGNNDENDEAPDALTFEEARRHALSHLQQAADSVKAQKEARKRKRNEHVERVKVEKSKSKESNNLNRLDDDVLKSLADDEPLPQALKRQKLSKNTERKITKLSPVKVPRNVKVDDGFIPLSSTGCTTQFNIVELKKAKKATKVSEKVLSLKERLLSKNPRAPVFEYIMYNEKQKAKNRLMKQGKAK